MHLHNSWIKCKWFAFKDYYHVRWYRSSSNITVCSGIFALAHFVLQRTHTHIRTYTEIINRKCLLALRLTEPVSLQHHHQRHFLKVDIFCSIFYFFSFTFRPHHAVVSHSVLKSYHHQHLLHGHNMWSTIFAIFVSWECVHAWLWPHATSTDFRFCFRLTIWYCCWFHLVFVCMMCWSAKFLGDFGVTRMTLARR